MSRGTRQFPLFAIAFCWVLQLHSASAFAVDAPSVDATKESKSGLEWLSQFVSVAKTFSGTSKDSHAPASFTFESASPGGSDKSVDLAVKGKMKDFSFGIATINVSPTAEWHRSTLDADPVDKLSLDVTWTTSIVLSDFNDHLGSDLRYKVARDFVADNNPNSAVWRIYYLEGERKGFWPGVHWRPSKDSEEVFFYLPSLGIDHYSKLKLKDTEFGQTVVLAPPVSGTFFNASLNFFVNLFADTLESRLTLNGSITFRDRVAGDSSISRSSSVKDFSLTYYFNRKRNVGFGVDYQQGRDPEQNFLSGHKVSVGLKLQVQ